MDSNQQPPVRIVIRSIHVDFSLRLKASASTLWSNSQPQHWGGVKFLRVLACLCLPFYRFQSRWIDLADQYWTTNVFGLAKQQEVVDSILSWSSRFFYWFSFLSRSKDMQSGWLVMLNCLVYTKQPLRCWAGSTTGSVGVYAGLYDW